MTKHASVRTPSSSGSSASKEWPSFVSGERSSNQRQKASASAIRSSVGSFGSPLIDAQLKACQNVRKLKSPEAARTFCSLVVPDRAVPMTITGPLIGCSAISGWRRKSRFIRSRLASRRTQLLLEGAGALGIELGPLLAQRPMQDRQRLDDLVVDEVDARDLARPSP